MRGAPGVLYHREGAFPEGRSVGSHLAGWGASWLVLGCPARSLLWDAAHWLETGLARAGWGHGSGLMLCLMEAACPAAGA